MKTNQITLKCVTSGLLCSFVLFFICSCVSVAQKNDNTDVEKYSVAAYIWPLCNGEASGRDLFWEGGIGECKIINDGNPRFEGHYQPKVPLWVYEMDNDPVVMEKMIDAATDHGVNVFIFDWYWYDGKPFLEESINDGFLKTRNNEKMKFYIMWANCDIPGNLLNYKPDMRWGYGYPEAVKKVMDG